MSTERPSLCRVCTAPTTPETSWNVFDFQEAAEGYSLAQLIALVGGIEVRPEERDLSAWCCLQCQLDVGIAYQVRVLCQESDRKLRKMLLEDVVAVQTEPLEGPEAIEIGVVWKTEVAELTEGDPENDEDGVLIEYNAEEDAEISMLEEDGSNSKTLDVFEEIPNTKKRCCACDQLFDTDLEILEHSKREHAVVNPPKATKHREVCEVCHRLMDRRNLELHKETPKTLFRCTTCDELFFTQEKVVTHHFTVHASTTTCNDCGKGFDSGEALGTHIEKVHLPHRTKGRKKKPRPNTGGCGRRILEDNQKFKCSKCPKLLATQEALEFHEYGHQNPFSFKCTRCADVFTDYNAYRTHLSTHRPPKDQFYICGRCGFRFKRRSSLRKHEVKYCSIPQKNKCHHCPASYVCQYELARHLKTSHPEKLPITEGSEGVEEPNAPETGQQSDQTLRDDVTEFVEQEDTFEDDVVYVVEVEEHTTRSEAEEENEEAESSTIETQTQLICKIEVGEPTVRSPEIERKDEKVESSNIDSQTIY